MPGSQQDHKVAQNHVSDLGMQQTNTLHPTNNIPTNNIPNGAPSSTPGGSKNLMEESDNLNWMDEKEDTTKLLFIFTLVVLVIAIGFWAYLYFAKVQKNSQLATLNSQYDELKTQMAQPEIALINETATRLSGGLKSLNQLVAGQVMYSQFFTELDKLVPNDVVVQNISIDEKNNVLLSANAPNLEQSAKLVKSLKNAPFLSDFILNGDAQAQVGASSFYNVSLSAILNPKLLIAKDEVTP